MKDNNSKAFFAIVSVSILCFLSCSNQVENPLTPTASLDLSSLTATPSSLLLSDEEVLSIVNQDNYLKGCEDTYNSAPETQIGFNEIYSGISTVDDVIEKFGEPYKVYELDNAEEDYFYSNKITSFAYDFYIINDVVETITILKDQILLDAQDVLETYGCPDLITALLLDDHGNSNSFNGVSFWYLEGGITVGFNRYPIKLSSPYVAISYQSPLDLDSLEFDIDSFTPVPYLSAVMNIR